MKKDKIIWLNGVSSSGKSTLAKALQQTLPEPYYVLANDMFTNDTVAPDKFISIDWARHITIRSTHSTKH